MSDVGIMWVYITLHTKEKGNNMGIKGCARQLIILNGKRDNMFEAAYFIVKADAHGAKKSDLVFEANRIIQESCFASKPVRKISRKMCFLLGGAAGAAAVGIMWALIALLL